MITYPSTKVVGATDVLCGVTFADPYRWLESDTEEVRAWQAAQARLASAYVREWPHFHRMQDMVNRFQSLGSVNVPRYAAGQWFRMRFDITTSPAKVVVSGSPTDQGRVLYDPTTEQSCVAPFVSWIAPSPDGTVLALGICADGSENNTIRLVHVPSGQLLDGAPEQILMDDWTGGVHWLSDSCGFFFTAIVGPAIDFKQQVYLHRRTPRPRTEAVDVPWTGISDYRMVTVSRDGQYAVALERRKNPIPVAIAKLAANDLPRFRPFVSSSPGALAGYVIGDRYIALTDVDAPRGRIVAIPLTAHDPNDPREWHELLKESDAVLRTMTPIGNVFYLTEFVDTYARVRMIDLDGRVLGEVPLPGRGAIGELPSPLSQLAPHGHPERFVFSFSSLTTSPGVYSHVAGETQITTIDEPKIRLRNAIVEDRWAVSKDGTRIPYHLVRGTGMDPTRPQPTLIYAYGGFNYHMAPEFPRAMAAFIECGGQFVHAHLRGGGEFGRAWWEAGRQRDKQNCYDDLYAIAEDLIAAGRCTPSMLAVTGRSNGGLMVGVAVTQRPELWAAAVPQVPFLDCIGGCRDSYGRSAVVSEFASIDDPEEVRRLATFSPYHLVRDGAHYPAIFIDAGDADPRCPAWHSRKFAARLQDANAGPTPILLSVRKNVGHGSPSDISHEIIADKVLAQTEWLAFIARQLRL